MKKSEIEKQLDWTPKELKDLQKKKKSKANNLLLTLINQKDEEGALLLVFDKSLEVNADIHNMDYNPLYLAIKKGMTNLVKEAFLNSTLKHKLNLDKDNKRLHESLAYSNSREMYDFIESINPKKSEMLIDTIYYTLGLGNLDLIKHLLNKKIEGQEVPITFSRAIIGYGNISSKENSFKELSEYTSFFANIENETNNAYITSSSKELFFTPDLLLKIMWKKDEASLTNYLNVVNEDFLKKDMVSVFKKREENFSNEKDLKDGIKWFLLKNSHIDFATNNTFNLKLRNDDDLNDFYEKIKLNKKLEDNLPEKSISGKVNKI